MSSQQIQHEFEPSPTAAIRVNSGECSYDDCDNDAEYMVKVEVDYLSSKFRACQSCSDENRLWAERYLPESEIR